jgi:tetratricopeptide (TPR) repeat protein
MHPTTSLIAACLLCLAALGAQAEESYGPSAEETRMLPPYCGGPGGGDWKAILGPESGFNNHTCYGINFLNRYYRAKTSWQKRDYLQNALGDFNYSVNHLSPGFKLMPEIFYYRGLTYRLMDRQAEAMGDFLKSIQLDPKYSKAVAELADLYDRNLSNRKKALELVSEGLRHNPASRELRRRYDRLGGKPPYPEPYAAPLAQDSPKTEPEALVPIPTPAPAAPTRPAAETPAPATATERAVGTPQQPATHGSPGNPWCRFCPDPSPAPDPAPSTPAAPPKAAP